MKLIVCSLLLFLVGCSSLVDTPPMISISYDHNYPWLQEPMYQAIDFWNRHDAIVVDGAESETDLIIDIKDLSNASTARVAQCHCYLGQGNIDMDPKLESRDNYTETYVGCVVAHEIGHAFGMQHIHVKDSLMSDVGILNKEYKNDCPWSVEDQKEFDRAKYQW